MLFHKLALLNLTDDLLVELIGNHVQEALRVRDWDTDHDLYQKSHGPRGNVIENPFTAWFWQWLDLARQTWFTICALIVTVTAAVKLLALSPARTWRWIYLAFQRSGSWLVASAAVRPVRPPRRRDFFNQNNDSSLLNSIRRFAPRLSRPGRPSRLPRPEIRLVRSPSCRDALDTVGTESGEKDFTFIEEGTSRRIPRATKGWGQTDSSLAGLSRNCDDQQQSVVVDQLEEN